MDMVLRSLFPFDGEGNGKEKLVAYIKKLNDKEKRQSGRVCKTSLPCLLSHRFVVKLKYKKIYIKC